MSVLVAHDGSSFASELVATAGAFAAAAGRSLRVLQVRESAVEPAIGSDISQTVTVDVQRRVGEPMEVICEYVAHEAVAVVALGTRSQRKAGLGHVAAPLLTCLRVPLLLVRPGMRPLKSLRRVLVPLEGGASTSGLMRFVSELLPATHHQLVGLHVATAAPPTEAGSLPALRMIDQWHYDWPAWREEFHRRLWGRSQAAEGCSLCVRVGEPAAVIVAEVDRQNADLVVAAWKGSLAPGRAACVRRLLESSPCPVLLVGVSQLQRHAGWPNSGEAGLWPRAQTASNSPPVRSRSVAANEETDCSAATMSQRGGHPRVA